MDSATWVGTPLFRCRQSRQAVLDCPPAEDMMGASAPSVEMAGSCTAPAGCTAAPACLPAHWVLVAWAGASTSPEPRPSSQASPAGRAPRPAAMGRGAWETGCCQWQLRFSGQW